MSAAAGAGAGLGLAGWSVGWSRGRGVGPGAGRGLGRRSQPGPGKKKKGGGGGGRRSEPGLGGGGGGGGVGRSRSRSVGRSRSWGCGRRRLGRLPGRRLVGDHEIPRDDALDPVAERRNARIDARLTLDRATHSKSRQRRSGAIRRQRFASSAGRRYVLGTNLCCPPAYPRRDCAGRSSFPALHRRLRTV